MDPARPLIGITTTARDEEAALAPWYDTAFMVPADYVDAVRRAGGDPVLLPPGRDDWERWLEFCDGFIVSGGADVGALNYGGDPHHPRQESPKVERDATELALTQQLVAASRPTLFVCRGLQVLNVACGGTLHQHLAEVLAEDIHRIEGDGWAYHSTTLEPGSLTAKAMGTDTTSGASGHHQAIAELGFGLRAVGLAPDGVVEAVEVEGDGWMIGVQWHPEVTAAADPAQQGLFDALTIAAQTRRSAGR